ncbi:nucleotidyltransferase domain-containing protein [Pontiella sulfatireligans]|uniref:Polymerase beta nucleotidyltransferase domain-containing protein n=1 Tax=Pontiella sulfatireligans TaxID=2750658 RepID=A0A6C2UGK9_9BACT|nr:nucleotidyltransferase domain-containing protein [Pontiella sulfatireligans]VGO18504.1 hypothetical protein SCARR_00557 [Pontiella sulfatireligans]
MPYGLEEETIVEILGIIAKNPKIEEAVLYGSRAKGTYRNGSDIDLTLKGEGLTASDAWGMLSELDDTSLPYSFDVSVFGEISNPDLVTHINRVGVVFYKRMETGKQEK